MPYPCSLLFNAEACKPTSGPYAGRYVMLFRNDYGADDAAAFCSRREQGLPTWEGTNLGMAVSDDGVDFEVMPEPVWQWDGELDGRPNEVRRVHDPRMTIVDGTIYLCLAVDVKHGVRGGIATTTDFKTFDVLSVDLPPEN